MDDPREARNRRVMEKDKWRSLHAREFNCELCEKGQHNKCVRPCYCRHKVLY